MIKSSFSILNSLVPFQGLTVTKRSATYFASRFNTQTSKTFASDGTGTHTQQQKVSCGQDNCNEKHCKVPCDENIMCEVIGHFSHKIPQDKEGNLISHVDANGNSQDQFFVKNKNKKTMTKENLEDFTEKDIKPNKKMNELLNQVDDFIDKLNK